MKSKSFYTVNPFSEEIITEFFFDSDQQIELKIQESFQQFKNYRNSSVETRIEWLKSISIRLEAQKDSLATLATLEMGKPLVEAIHEVEKCIGLCNYFIENTQDFLLAEEINYLKKAVITKSPVGIVLGIMPWNYPFWQVFRFAIPALMAGNAVILKHAPNVTGSAVAILEIFRNSKLPEGLFQLAIASVPQTQLIIQDSRIQRISFTGSNKAGFQIASTAGAVGKKCVLELGGSDPFVVLEDASLEMVVPLAIKSRFINAGQSCISAKRFIIHSKVFQSFAELFVQKARELVLGNPLDPQAQIGPLARIDLKENISRQMKNANAEILFQSEIPDKGFFAPISVVKNVPRNSALWQEEVFGPIASLVSFDRDDEMLDLANDTPFGLGASIWSDNTEKAFSLAQQIDAGNVYVNEMMKSDFSLPFGGNKQSGYGKELSKSGMMEFVNLKTSIISSL